jgi:hypothetical protein
MNVMWQEMLAWSVPERMAMAVQLMHASANDVGTDMIDAGLFDGVAGREIYCVAATGAAAEVLRGNVASILRSTGDKGRTIQRGLAPTPLGTSGGGEDCNPLDGLR